MSNKDLISCFETLHKYNEKLGIKGKVIAYTKIIHALKSVKGKIKTLKSVDGVPQIGPKTKEKISEWLETGTIEECEHAKKELGVVDEKCEFEKIWGIGPVKARKLVDLDIDSIKKLKQNTHLLTDQQKIGLKYFKELQERIPRNSIKILKKKFTKIFKEMFADLLFKIAGSFRRKQQTSGDIDVVICSESNSHNLGEIVEILTVNNIITDVLSIRDEKFMGICLLENGQYARIDIEFVPVESFVSCLLYFTGSKEFNVNMRHVAKEKGLTLNQHGLFNSKNKLVLIPEKEMDIFDYLGMEYVKPEDR